MRAAGIVLLVLCTYWYHPIHVSVTNMDLDPGRGTVELSVKIFADDFQDLIFHRYSVQLRLTEQENPGDKIDAVNRYIASALQMEINGKPAEGLQFLESRLNEGAIWLYYKYNYGGRINSLKIRNTLMLEKFDDQTNLLIVAYNDKENGYMMDNKTTELTLNIK
jgi:hypothetical protein